MSTASQGSADDKAAGETGALIAVYRTLPARIIGWLMIVAVGAVGYIVIRGELALGRGIFFPVASLCFVVMISWIFLLRPSVELRSGSVVQRNILRDTVVPFSRLEDVKFEWALELIDTSGRRHSSWAIPRQREFSARRSFDSFAETTARKKAKPGPTAQAVAGDVLREHQRWLLSGGKIDATPTPTSSLSMDSQAPARVGAQARWALSAVAPLGISVVALAFAIATDS